MRIEQPIKKHRYLIPIFAEQIKCMCCVRVLIEFGWGTWEHYISAWHICIWFYRHNHSGDYKSYACVCVCMNQFDCNLKWCGPSFNWIVGVEAIQRNGRSRVKCIKDYTHHPPNDLQHKRKSITWISEIIAYYLILFMFGWMNNQFDSIFKLIFWKIL